MRKMSNNRKSDKIWYIWYGILNSNKKKNKPPKHTTRGKNLTGIRLNKRISQVLVSIVWLDTMVDTSTQYMTPFTDIQEQAKSIYGDRNQRRSYSGVVVLTRERQEGTFWSADCILCFDQYHRYLVVYVCKQSLSSSWYVRFQYKKKVLSCLF